MKTIRVVLAAGSVLYAVSALASVESDVEQLLEARLYKKANTMLMEVTENDPDYAVAQRLLGELYTNGIGVKQNPVRAIEHLRAAATKEDAEAMYLLGRAYELGIGVAVSAASAYSWYDKAAGQHPMAAARYAEIALANQDRSGFVSRHDPLSRLRFAADHGVPRAKFLIGKMGLVGKIDGIDRDEAMRLLEESAEEEAEANTVLGELEYQGGEFATAIERFERALSMGDARAAAYLGHCAEHGIAQDIDRRKAWDYYNQAGNTDWAKDGLDRLAAHARSIELMGVRMYGISRKELWRRFSEMELPLLANEAHWDVFDASSRMGNKAVVVTVAYSPAEPEYVAEVSYRFTGGDRRDARSLYADVLDSLNEKYGDATDMVRDEGAKRLFWVIEETRIELYEDRKQLGVNVTYQMRPYSTELRDYLAANSQDGGLRDAL